MTGRPTDYTPEIATRICSLIAEGNSLVAICRDNDWTPDKSTVYRWLMLHEAFRDIYTRAKQDSADAHSDEIQDISDSATPDNVNVARLRIETRKWIAAKLKPKKYGDSTLLKHADPDGNPMPLSNILGAIDGRTAGLPGTEEKAGGSKLEAK